MKITELSQNINIALSNEEAALLERIESVQPLSAFSERDKVVISGLVRKSCLSKTVVNKSVMVVKNESGYN
jgi:hypothetical protein